MGGVYSNFKSGVIGKSDIYLIVDQLEKRMDWYRIESCEVNRVYECWNMEKW